MGKAITLRSSNFASDVQKKRKRSTGLPCRAGVWEGGQKCKRQIVCVQLCVCVWMALASQSPCPETKAEGMGVQMRAAGLLWDAGVLQAEWKFQTRFVLETLPLSHKGQKGSP